MSAPVNPKSWQYRQLNAINPGADRFKVIEGEIDGPRICYALRPGALAPLASFIDGLSPAPTGPCCLPATTGEDA